MCRSSAPPAFPLQIMLPRCGSWCSWLRAGENLPLCPPLVPWQGFMPAPAYASLAATLRLCGHPPGTNCHSKNRVLGCKFCICPEGENSTRLRAWAQASHTSDWATRLGPNYYPAGRFRSNCWPHRSRPPTASPRTPAHRLPAGTVRRLRGSLTIAKDTPRDTVTVWDVGAAVLVRHAQGFKKPQAD